MRVGEGEEVLASSVGVEVVISVSLDLVVNVVLCLSSESVDSLYEVIDLRVGIHVSPERFSVCRVHTTTISLFITIVDNGDTD